MRGMVGVIIGTIFIIGGLSAEENPRRVGAAAIGGWCYIRIQNVTKFGAGAVAVGVWMTQGHSKMTHGVAGFIGLLLFPVALANRSRGASAGHG